MLVDTGSESFPIFFCFIAYQLILYVVVQHVTWGRTEISLSILGCCTLAFMIMVQIVFGQWDGSKAAKITAAIIILVAGGFAIVHVILTIVNHHKEFSESGLVYYITNFLVIATFCMTSGVLQFMNL